jgi:hypothetical protein
MFSLWFPKIAHAAPANIKALIGKIEILLVNPFIKLMFAAALVLFLYGVFEFIQGAEGDDARTKGRSHMIYGLIGMFVMVSVFGIMRLLANSLGVQNTNNYSTLPQ